MEEFTILLLRPDYTTDSYGQDTYMTTIHAESVEEAQRMAQEEVVAEDSCGDPDGYFPEDYAVLMVIRGHHNDIKEV